MKACVLHNIGDLRYEEIPVPEPGCGEVRIRVRACGVCGSDIPRIFEKGTYHFPLIPGHEFAGVVDAVGQEVDTDLVGKSVAVFPLIPCRNCRQCEMGAYAQCERYDYLGSRRNGAFAEFVCAPVWNLVPMPAGLSFEEAALAEPAAVAAHAMGLAAVSKEDAVLIMGAGPIGLIAAGWARLSGAGNIILCDIDDAKLDFARSLGYGWLCNSREPGSVVSWLDQMLGYGADVVIEASGSPQALEQGMMAARPFGRVILVGNPAGEMRFSAQAYSAILRKELRICGSWNSHPENDWPQALISMAEKEINLRSLITHRVSLEQLPDASNMMRTRAQFFCKVLCVNE